MKILHYGLQRSGTNLLESFLKKYYCVHFLNSNVDRSSPLQKHVRLYREKKIIPEPQYSNGIVINGFNDFEHLFKVIPEYYLIISKDPYSWLLSYKNWARKCNWPEVDHNYIQEYNLFYGFFIKLAQESSKFIFVKYVDLITDKQAMLKDLQNKMGLKRRLFSGRLELPSRVPQSQALTNDRLDFYMNERYLEQYQEKELINVNEILDFDVAASLGYDILDATKAK